jgi:cell wall-associated NlpC family hydrolase
VGTPISRSQLLPGDLGFFVRDGHVHHVAIWTGNGRILEAPDIGVPIREVLLSSLPYASEMTILRRVL